MTWYNLSINAGGKKIPVKYFRLQSEKKEYPYCDADGKLLTRVSGTIQKGHFVDSEGNKHEKAFRLINGKATEEFRGRIKEAERTKEIPINEIDIIAEKQFIIDSEELYDYLKKNNTALVFGGWFGTGYNGEKCYVYPSPLFPNFCEMTTGISSKLQVGRQAITQLQEDKRLRDKLKSVDITIQKVAKAQVDDLIQI